MFCIYFWQFGTGQKDNKENKITVIIELLFIHIFLFVYKYELQNAEIMKD